MSDGPKVVYIKKKGKHGGGHHGGAWKVAYADFVTAMMALFIVLWLLTQTDSASRERIAQYFRTGSLPGGTMVHGHTAGSNPPMAINIFPVAPPPRPKTASEEEKKELKKVASAIYGLVVEGERAKSKKKAEKKGDKKKEKEKDKDKDKEPKEADEDDLAKHLRARVVDEGALIELIDGGDNFMFTVASSSLKSGAVALLKRLAPILASVPNKIEIHGHTDARRFDPKAPVDNWDLSFERANQARQVLEQNGLPKDRVSAVLAHADSEPYNPKDPFSPENRRLSILVVRSGHEDVRAGNVGPQFKLPGSDAKGPEAEKKGEGHDEHSATPAEPAGHGTGDHPSTEDKPGGEHDSHDGEPQGEKDPGAGADPSQAEHETEHPPAAAVAEPKRAPERATPAHSARSKHKGQAVSANLARRLRSERSAGKPAEATAEPSDDAAAHKVSHENSPKKAK